MEGESALHPTKRSSFYPRVWAIYPAWGPWPTLKTANLHFNLVCTNGMLTSGWFGRRRYRYCSSKWPFVSQHRALDLSQLLRWPLLLYWTSYIFYLHKHSSEAGKYYHLSVTNEEQKWKTKKSYLSSITKKCSLTVKRKSGLKFLASCLAARSHSFHII